MACVTLKRSLEHDPASVASSTKRRRFHHCGSRSPSSPTSLTSSASMSHLAGSSSACGALTFVPPPAAPSSAESDAASDFPASRLPPELLSQRLTAEVRRLQRRRLIPSAPTIGGGGGGGSASDTEMPAASLCAQCGAAAVKAAAAGCCSTSLSPSSSSSTQSEPALFTLSQVQSIAEKLLSEREQQIRSEFQALLSAKLQEQYDAFLRFNHDQIYRMHSGAPMSYVS